VGTKGASDPANQLKPIRQPKSTPPVIMSVNSIDLIDSIVRFKKNS